MIRPWRCSSYRDDLRRGVGWPEYAVGVSRMPSLGHPSMLEHTFDDMFLAIDLALNANWCRGAECSNHAVFLVLNQPNFMVGQEFAFYDPIMRLRASEIKRLCDSYLAAIAQTGTIGRDEDIYRLLANGMTFHELEYDDLRTAAVELTKLLLCPGVGAVISADHFSLWGWCADLLFDYYRTPSPYADKEIYELAKVTTDAALANAAGWGYIPSYGAEQYVIGGQIALSYLCFPLLEAVVRRATPAFLERDGIVRQPFVRSGGGQYSIGKRCSNLEDELRLLRDYVAGLPLKDDIAQILAHAANIDGSSSDGCSTIFAWRNSSLHGEITRRTVGGTIFGLALTIALDSIQASYNARRDAIAERVNWEMRTRAHGIRSRPDSFYPVAWENATGGAVITQ